MTHPAPEERLREQLDKTLAANNWNPAARTALWALIKPHLAEHVTSAVQAATAGIVEAAALGIEGMKCSYTDLEGSILGIINKRLQYAADGVRALTPDAARLALAQREGELVSRRDDEWLDQMGCTDLCKPRDQKLDIKHVVKFFAESIVHNVDAAYLAQREREVRLEELQSAYDIWQGEDSDAKAYFDWMLRRIADLEDAIHAALAAPGGPGEKAQ